MNDDRTTRTSLSLVLSTMFHGSAIALIALGPTFIPGLGGQGDRESSMVEFTLSGDAELSDIKPVEVQPTSVAEPVIVTKPEPVTKTDVIVAKKPEPKVKKTAPALPEKVEPQVAEVVQKDTTETVEESPVVAAAEEEVSSEDIKENAPSVVAETPVDEEKVADVEEQVTKVTDEQFAEDQAPLPTPEPRIKEQVTPVAATATSSESLPQKGTADESQNSQAGDTKIISVTQNYLGLQQLSGNKPPQYTNRMRLNKLQGRGQLVYLVNENGTVGEIRLVKSTGSPELDNAAIQAFSKYKFVPGQKGYTIHDFEFSLKGPEESAAGRLRTTMNP